ncbi:MAG: Hpt domain-containing protein [Schleiferiaceae bacterium]|jgi:HPt (histidine-containing phosphotransfer) domain-containing protein|nr:Hpt domain-containing protein [Schleiferiaceae bacterium]
MYDRDKIARLLGNPDKVDDFIQLFKEESKSLFDQLKLTFHNKNYEALNRQAHSLKNHFEYVGLSKLSNLAFALEMESEKQKNASRIALCYHKLVDHSTEKLSFLNH